jgi:site-specific DNA-methyltransferase (adenine-specific)
MKSRGAVVMTASQPFTSMLVMSNLKWFRYEWVWNKVMVSNIANAPRMPLRAHESVLVFSMGHEIYNAQLGESGAPFGKKSGTNSQIVGQLGDNYNVGVGWPKTILTYPRPNNLTGGGLHPTQKPVALFEYLIRTYTEPGALVLDPFVGSGTTAIAARNLGRRFIVGDLSQEYVDIARARLAQPWQPALFDPPAPADPPAPSPEQVGLFEELDA